MSTLWGDPVDREGAALTARRVASTRQKRLYLGSLRILNGEPVLVTALDRETATALVIPVEEAALTQPSWWLTNRLSTQSSKVSWGALDTFPAALGGKIRVWPPLPVLMAGMVRDYPVTEGQKDVLPKLLTVLDKIGRSYPGGHDTFVVMPQLRGGPTLAWHRNGNCVAGFQINPSEVPSEIHDQTCPEKDPNEPKKSRGQSTKAFQNYTTESQHIYEEVTQKTGTSIVRPVRLIEIYSQAKCRCAATPPSDYKAFHVPLSSGEDAVQYLQRMIEPFLRRALETISLPHEANRRWVNQHARRLARYGVTEIRDQPQKISNRARDEIEKLSTSDQPVVIRFGPAGSGKTSMLAQVAARLTWLGKRVAIITFTNASKNVIDSRIENETIADRAQYFTSTISDLLPPGRKRKVIEAAMNEKRQLNSTDFTKAMYVGDNMHDVEEANDKDFGAERHFDALLVDEAEDFTAEMWDFLVGTNPTSTWKGGENLQQIFVTFDDAQAALGDSGVRSFEQQAPREWTETIFSKRTNVVQLKVRPQFSNMVDYAWLKFNLRQSGSIAAVSAAHRNRFREQDPGVENGYEGDASSSVEEHRLGSLTQLFEFFGEQARRADTLIVCPDRLMVAATTLWMDHPAQFVTQSEFLDDRAFEYASQRGDRDRAGIWFEAPEVRTKIYRGRSDGSDSEAISPLKACEWAHRKLNQLDRTSKTSVRPTDIRTRILTYPAARGHEAETAIIVIPEGGALSSEQIYIGLSRAQKKLIKLTVPPWEELLAGDDTSAGRLVKVLQALRVGTPSTGAIWPRLQVDLWRWEKDEGLEYLENGAINKVLEWYQKMENELNKHPDWRDRTHCLDGIFTNAAGSTPPTPKWRNYGAWVKSLKSYTSSK